MNHNQVHTTIMTAGQRIKHEINNPLQIATGNIQMFLMETAVEDDHRLQKALVAILRAAEAVNKIANQIDQEK